MYTRAGLANEHAGGDQDQLDESEAVQLFLLPGSSTRHLTRSHSIPGWFFNRSVGGDPAILNTTSSSSQSSV